MNAPMVMPLEEKLERALQGLSDKLETAAEMKANAEAAEERKKQILSAMVVHYRGEGMGVGEAEHQARASKPYKDASEEWIAANFDYRKADAKADSARLRFEAWRTASSNKRAEMNLR